MGNRNSAHFEQQHRLSILGRRSEAMPRGGVAARRHLKPARSRSAAGAPSAPVCALRHRPDLLKLYFSTPAIEPVARWKSPRRVVDTRQMSDT